MVDNTSREDAPLTEVCEKIGDVASLLTFWARAEVPEDANRPNPIAVQMRRRAVAVRTMSWLIRQVDRVSTVCVFTGGPQTAESPMKACIKLRYRNGLDVDVYIEESVMGQDIKVTADMTFDEMTDAPREFYMPLATTVFTDYEGMHDLKYMYLSVDSLYHLVETHPLRWSTYDVVENASIDRELIHPEDGRQ